MCFWETEARWFILTRKMDLKLDNLPTVIYVCFVLHNFVNIITHIDEDLVKLQTEVAKRNNEGIDNALTQFTPAIFLKGKESDECWLNILKLFHLIVLLHEK